MPAKPNLKLSRVDLDDPDNNIEEAYEASTKIYAEYGVFTSAASVIATWAIIQASFPS